MCSYSLLCLNTTIIIMKVTMGSIDWELVAGVWHQKVNGNYQIWSGQKTTGDMKRSDTKSCNL